MSEKSESQSSPPPTPLDLHNNPADLVSDIVLWRRKKLNFVILLAATATWIVIDVYQYNLITVLSWMAMFLVICLFFWGNTHRLLKKETPDLSELEISEETAMEYANLFKQGVEHGIRLVLHVSIEREWFVFAGVVASLYLISLAARNLDLLTFCYLGLLGGMTIPITYVKNERRIREFGHKLRIKSQRLYAMIEEKLQKMKNKITGKHKQTKEKKLE